ncbi:O-antigen ligase family protein [Sphingomonas sp. CGMCC 1.13658]|jgi:O-antigen ligase|nr:O-antigen ligase family protein [Sphingomonas sp. CGMCC 1.13658]MBA2919776.1 O-antigen ligase family protein [Sphingomonas sp. CGMCC 1.13658]
MKWAQQIDPAFWALAILLSAAFLFGGGSRDDILSLVILRPLAVLCLGLGLWTLNSEHLQRYRSSVIWLGALLALAVIHLIPLPPAIWTALPGRELPSQAAIVAGVEQPWLPIALIPWRAWNAFYSLLVPIGIFVLAVQMSPEQRQRLTYLAVALILLSAAIAIAQVVTGYNRSLYFYRVTNFGEPTGLFANRNHFALLMCCAFPLFGAIVPTNRNPDRNATFILLGILLMSLTLVMLVLLTGSRAGLVLAPLAIALTALVLDPQPRRSLISRHRKLIVGAAAGLVLLLIAIAIYMSRASAIDRLLTTGPDELRLSSWGPIFAMLGKYFPVGAGIGSFVDVYRIDEPRQILGTAYLNHAHNDWLEWGFTLGLPGILLLISAIGLWCLSAVRLVRERPERLPHGRLARASAVILLLVGLASLLDYPSRTPVIACLLAWSAVLMTSRPPESRTLRKGNPTQAFGQ